MKVNARFVGFWLLCFTLFGTGLLSAGISENRQIAAEIRKIIQTEGDIAYTALLQLPETRNCNAIKKRFARTRQNYRHHEPPKFSPAQKNYILKHVTKHLADSTYNERLDVYDRLTKWVRSEKLVRMFCAGPDEYVLSVAYMMPQTRHLFKYVVESRKLNPEKVDPKLIAETMSTTEWQDFYNKLLLYLSELQWDEFVEYFVGCYEISKKIN